jgi:phenylpropionate dioxygenase-like ring-hydroxylating dioxygenase large terminal subunit
MLKPSAVCYRLQPTWACHPRADDVRSCVLCRQRVAQLVVLQWWYYSSSKAQLRAADGLYMRRLMAAGVQLLAAVGCSCCSPCPGHTAEVIDHIMSTCDEQLRVIHSSTHRGNKQHKACTSSCRHAYTGCCADGLPDLRTA